LRLWSCSLDWKNAGLRNLTTLSLTGGVPDDAKASFTYIIAVLQHSPHLETLEIRNFILSNIGDPDITIEKLLLPNLHTLNLETELEPAVMLLSLSPCRRYKNSYSTW
jgi:hypothetical protein